MWITHRLSSIVRFQGVGWSHDQRNTGIPASELLKLNHGLGPLAPQLPKGRNDDAPYQQAPNHLSYSPRPWQWGCNFVFAAFYQDAVDTGKMWEILDWFMAAAVLISLGGLV